MILTIDNLDGLGAVDYSAAIARGGADALTITRTLNAPSIAGGLLCLEGSSLLKPLRQARIALTSAAGTVLFTGYLATEPVAIYAGVACAGPVYRLAFSAISDEWLLDKQAAGSPAGLALGVPASAVLSTLAARLDAGLLSTAGLTSARSVGVFEPRAAAAWSAHAGAAANSTYEAYRAVGGVLNLTPGGDVVHALSDGDGTLAVAALRTSAVRELANDVTVSGEMEAATYVTELFVGDGITAAFDLAGEPDAPAAGHATLVADDFSEGVFNRQIWSLGDSGSHLAITGDGLTLSGGNGIDGNTTLTALDPVEIGGTLVMELAGVTLNPGSAGTLGGFYMGSTMQANLFAGFNVSQSGGNTVVTPVVNGVLTGTPATIVSGHRYTLRIHLHCPEVERVKQTYYAMVEGVVEQFGGGVSTAPAALVFELRDLASSSNTFVTVLYDGSVASAPAQANFVPVNSVELFGSVAAITLTRTGSAWVTSTDPTSGTVFTRLAGRTTDGVDLRITSSATGKVTFFAGRIPLPFELVTVLYRGRRRAVARLEDAASIAAEAAGGAVGTARWVGKVLRPQARSSQDCENAAQAILSFSTNRAAAVTGSYVMLNPAALGPADVWPGDLLALTQDGGVTSVLVRRITIEEQGAVPETLTYRIAFANDWAEGLGITLSEAIASDALIPQTALSLAPAAAAPVLANLQQMTVIVGAGAGASSTSMTVDAGLDPPAGGGFEVRRHDGGFGMGAAGSASGDLVLRSPVRGFSIPRAALEEKFFVRMYDASSPPLYSRWSSAIVTQLPLSYAT